MTLSTKKSHRGRSARKKFKEHGSVLHSIERRSDLLDFFAQSMALASAYKIVYLVPHLPQNMEAASAFGWYTDGLHEAAGPLATIAMMPADIRELFAEKQSVLIGRLTRHIWKMVTPISIDALMENFSLLNNEPFRVLVSNNEEIASQVDALVKGFSGPTLHISRFPGEGRVIAGKFNTTCLINYCRLVVQHLRQIPQAAEFAEIAIRMLDSQPTRKIQEHPLKQGFHNLTTPNEVALRSLGWTLRGKDSVSFPELTVDCAVDRYVERICQSADAVSAERNLLVGEKASDLIDYRYILAVQSFYWGHFGGFRKRISDADSPNRELVKLIYRGTVQATTYFDELTPAYQQALKSKFFKAVKAQQAADAKSFTAGLSLLSSATLAPVLRLEPKLNQVRGDLKQIGFCARSRGRHGRVRKLSRMAGELGQRMRDLVHPEFLKRIDAPNAHGIEGMKFVADIPLELMLSNGIPLSLRFDVSRLPVLPGNLYLANCVTTPVILPLSAFCKIIVIRSFSKDDPLRHILEIAISTVLEKAPVKTADVTFVDVETEDGFVDALKNFSGAIMIFDGHGTYDSGIGAGKLVIGGKAVDAWKLRKRVVVPPIVIFSACDTQPLDGSHSSVATSALTLGARSVLATFLPINGVNTGVFVGRLLLRLMQFLPVALEVRRIFTWREVVSGLLRMSHVTEVVQTLRKHMGHKYLDGDYEKVQLAANMAINARDPQWHRVFVDQLAGVAKIPVEQVYEDVTKWGGLTESLKYVQLGSPENIIIVDAEQSR